MASLADAWSDLWLGGRCAGCLRPGRSLCDGCREALMTPPRFTWPDPTPPGMPTPVCVADYDGVVRNVLLAHKEQGRYGLHRPLGEALARAVELLVHGDVPDRRPAVLVPVPSPAAVVRRRGHDPLLRMTRTAAVGLRARGFHVAVVPALRQRRRPEDQSGLGSAARAQNLAGAFAVWPRAVRRMAGRVAVITDDIVTTGSTGAEAARALTEVRAEVRGLATVAATRRRGPSPAAGIGGEPRAGPESGPALPLRRPGD